MIHGSLGLVCGNMEDFGDTEKLQSAVRREQGGGSGGSLEDQNVRREVGRKIVLLRFQGGTELEVTCVAF